MGDLVATIFPIPLLLGLGALLRISGLIDRQTIEGLKRIVMDVCLPAVLFLTFLTLELRAEYLWLTFATFGFVTTLFVLGLLTGLVFKQRGPVLPYLSTGFAFGFVGIPLYTIVFGKEHFGLFSVVGLGHELFVWLLYYPVLMMRYERNQSLFVRIRALTRSPIFVAIFLATALNGLGIDSWFQQHSFGISVLRTLKYLADVTTPMILVSIGYGLRFELSGIRESVFIVAFRFLLVFAVGTAFRVLLVEQFILAPAPFVRHAFFSFLVLPPLFSLPVFFSANGDESSERAAGQTIAVSTMVSLVLFTAYATFIVGSGL